MSLIVKIKRGRRDVVASTPLQDLFLTVLLGSLSLVETLEGTIVTLVKSPCLVVGKPETVHLLSDVAEGLDGTCQIRGEGDIELEALLLEHDTGLVGLLDSLGGKVNIMPASESVLKIPGGLSVADKDDFVSTLCNSADHSCLRYLFFKVKLIINLVILRHITI